MQLPERLRRPFTAGQSGTYDEAGPFAYRLNGVRRPHPDARYVNSQKSIDSDNAEIDVWVKDYIVTHYEFRNFLSHLTPDPVILSAKHNSSSKFNLNSEIYLWTLIPSGFGRSLME